MLNSPVLNLIILLSFTYFVGSLILSSINEFITGALKMRQKQLIQALQNFFFNSPSWKLFIDKIFFNSPQIQALMKSKDKYPSYISASAFVSVIIEQIGSANYNAAGIGNAIQNSGLPQELKTVLLNLLAKAQNNMDDFEKELEAFYDEAMERTSGWYKKKVRKIMFIVSIILSIALNIDTLKIADDALANPVQLDKIAGNISNTVSGMTIQNDVLIVEVKNRDTSIKKTTDTLIKMVTTIDTSGSSTMSDAKSRLKKIEILYTETTGYKLGYNNFDELIKDWKVNWRRKLLGILITIFALQLGANYWFDLLNKVVNLRATGKKPVAKQSV